MRATHVFITIVTLSAVVGCDSPPPKKASASTASMAEVEHESHEHTHRGPHNGHIVELGHNHKYHAELIKNTEFGSLEVYILDEHLNELPIESQSVVVSLLADGQNKTVELLAIAAQDGKASRFETNAGELFDSLHKTGAKGKLRVTIDGTPYSGEIDMHADDHTHDDHGHQH